MRTSDDKTDVGPLPSRNDPCSGSDMLQQGGDILRTQHIVPTMKLGMDTK